MTYICVSFKSGSLYYLLVTTVYIRIYIEFIYHWQNVRIFRSYFQTKCKYEIRTYNSLTIVLNLFWGLTLFDPLAPGTGTTKLKVASMDISQILWKLTSFITFTFEMPIKVQRAGFHWLFELTDYLDGRKLFQIKDFAVLKREMLDFLLNAGNPGM